MASHSDLIASLPKGIVINELLCCISNYIDYMPHDDIVKLCVDFYDEEEIKTAKRVAYDYCNEDNKERFINRTKKDLNMKSNDMKDILKIITLKGDNIPLFLAANLDKVPKISFDRLDVSQILTKLSSIENKVLLLSSDMSEQKTISSELINRYANHSERWGKLENKEKIGMMVRRPENATELNNMKTQYSISPDNENQVLLTHSQEGNNTCTLSSQEVPFKEEEQVNLKTHSTDMNEGLDEVSEISLERIHAVPVVIIPTEYQTLSESMGACSINMDQSSGHKYDTTELNGALVLENDDDNKNDETLKWSQVVQKPRRKTQETHQTRNTSVSQIKSSGSKPRPIQPWSNSSIKRKKIVTGTLDSNLNTGSFSGIVKPPLEIFASRFHPNLEASELKSILENMVECPVLCEKVNSLQNKYSSFKITTECSAKAIYNSAIWPKGVTVRKFYPRNTRQNIIA